MSVFNKKSSSESQDQRGDNAGGNKVKALILLVLIGVFAYLYVFTNIIVTHEAAAPNPPASPPEVKQSMPPRPAETGATAPAAALPAPAPAPAKPAAPAAAAVAAKPATPPPAPTPAAAKPAQTQQPATAKTPPPAAPAPVKKEAAKPAAIKPAATIQAATKPAAKKEEPKTAMAVAKPVTAKPASPEKTVRKKIGTYVLTTGTLPAGDAVAAADAKLEKQGIKPVLKLASQKGRTVHRLFVKSYSDYDAFSAGLEKLKQTTKSAFGIEKDGKYLIFAGSFSSVALAQKEKTHLQRRGIPVEIQLAVLPGATVTFTAGSFASKAAADKTAAALKKEGLTVRVIPKGN